MRIEKENPNRLEVAIRRDEQKKEDAQQAAKERKAHRAPAPRKEARDRIAAAIAQAIATQRTTDAANRVLLDEAIEYAVELLNQEREA